MRRDPHETREEALRAALADVKHHAREPLKTTNERERPMPAERFEERRGEAPGRRATDIDRETQLALQDREIQLLHEELDELRAKVDALQADREKALRWGISVLGAAVLGMGSWIFSLFASNLPKGH